MTVSVSEEAGSPLTPSDLTATAGAPVTLSTPPRIASPRTIAWRGMLVGVAAVAVSVVCRYVLESAFGQEESFRLFFAAVVVAAWYGGLWPGLVTMALSTITASVLYFTPHLGDSLYLMRTALFLIESMFACALCSQLHRAWHRLAASERETRELERQLLQASEAEQRRIGHDLHDGLGQQLTGLALMGKTLAQRLRNRNVPEAQDAAKLADMANAAIRQTRELARGLAPLNADALDLPDALQRLSETVGEVSRSTVVLRIESAPPPMRPEATMHLFRIAQEALTNAMRHADASRIEVTLDHDGEATLLSIADNGKGLPKPPKTPGMGLRLMQYRAKLIGGSLRVEARHSGGTVVRCRVPDVMEPARGMR